MDLEALNSMEPLSLTEAIRFYEALGAAVTLNQPHWGDVTVEFETRDEWGNLEAVSTQVYSVEMFCRMAAVAEKLREEKASRTARTSLEVELPAAAFMLAVAWDVVTNAGSLPTQA